MSTAVELLGFTALDLAGWRFGVTTGLIVTGIFLLFIGYSLDDEAKPINLISLITKLKSFVPNKKSSL